jgi:5-amino-6-(5-phosphoribosylamino)uracil reductase
VPDRPYTLLSCAVSIDGYLDDASTDRLILSGPEDLDEVDALRAAADAILVGAGTVRADNPRLLVRDLARIAAREAAGRPPQPLRVTMTAAGDLDPAARIFAGPGTALVYCPSAAAAAAGRKFKGRAAVIDAGAELSLAAVLHDLHIERTVATVLIEGGARILRDALAGGLADELRLAIAPFFVADPSAPRFALPARYPQTPSNPMTLTSLRQVGSVAVHRYRLTPNLPPWPLLADRLPRSHCVLGGSRDCRRLSGRLRRPPRQPEREQGGEAGEADRPPEGDMEGGGEVPVVRGDGALEDHRQDRDAEGAADLLSGPGQHARVGDLGAVESEVGDRHDRDRDGAEPEAAR